MARSILPIILLLIPVSLFAQIDETDWLPFEGKRVVRIDLSGPFFVQKRFVLADLGVEIGEPFDFEEFQAGIQRLIDLRKYQSFHVTPSEVEDGMVIELSLLAIPVGAPAAVFLAEKLEDSLYLPYEGLVVAEITITGNNITKDYVIRRELDTRVAGPFSLDEMKEDLIRLENLGIFSSVRVIPEAGEKGVHLEYRVREMPWILPYLKFRYNEQDGFSIGPALTSLNLFGRAIGLSGFALFGGETSYSVIFEYPWIAWNHFGFDFVGSDLTRDDPIREFEEDSQEFTPRFSTWIGEKGRAKALLSWFRMKSDKDGITLSPDNQDNLFRIGGSLGWDSRDSWRNPHRGWQNEIQFIKTGGYLGGDGDLWTADLDLRRFQPVTERQTLLLGSLASFQTGEPGTDVPSYFTYHIGGANTVRGHDIEKTGRKIFGKNQWILTAEHQYLLMGLREYEIWKWSVNAGLELAFFADSGIAWSDESNFSLERWRTGVGTGLRLLVPGPNEVRLDLAYSRSDGAQFHLGINPTFEAQRLRVR